jgi:hypothetical protein
VRAKAAAPKRALRSQIDAGFSPPEVLFKTQPHSKYSLYLKESQDTLHAATKLKNPPA